MARKPYHKNQSGPRTAAIIARENESLESLIRRFKKSVDDEGILKEYKDRQYFVKPSVKRRLKDKESKRKERQRNALSEKKISSSLNTK